MAAGGRVQVWYIISRRFAGGIMFTTDTEVFENRAQCILLSENSIYAHKFYKRLRKILSPSTKMHGPPKITRSESSFSLMYLRTASSSAPGWSHRAGIASSLAFSRMPRVTYFYLSLSLNYKRQNTLPWVGL